MSKRVADALFPHIRMTYEEAEGRVSIVSMPFYNPAVPDEPEEEPTGFFATLLGMCRIGCSSRRRADCCCSSFSWS